MYLRKQMSANTLIKTRHRTPQKSVIPAKAGIQRIIAKYDLPELFEKLRICLLTIFYSIYHKLSRIRIKKQIMCFLKQLHLTWYIGFLFLFPFACRPAFTSCSWISWFSFNRRLRTSFLASGEIVYRTRSFSKG